MLTFFGALVLSGVAAVLYGRDDRDSSILGWVVSTMAFGCLAWALVLHGRATGSAGDAEARASDPAAAETLTLS